MKRLFAAEFYRLRISKSPLIILIVCFGMSVIMGITSGMMYGNAPWLNELYDKYLGINPFGVLGEMDVYGFSSIRTVPDFIATSSGNSCVYLVLFIAIFLLPLRRSGFVKNIASEFTRTQIFFTHVLLIVIYAFLLTDISALGMTLMSFVFFRGLELGGIGNFLVYLITAGMLVSAIGIVVLMLSDLMRRQTPAIVLSIIYLWIIAPTLFTIGDVATMFRSGSNFRVQYVSLVGNLQLLKAGKWDTVLSSLLVIAAYVGVSVLLELTLIKRRDLI